MTTPSKASARMTPTDAPEPTPAVERACTVCLLVHDGECPPMTPAVARAERMALLWFGGKEHTTTRRAIASHVGAALLDVEEMAEMLVPVVYAQNPSHYEDGEGFIRVKPWEWLTEGYQQMIRDEARDYVGYIRAHLLGGAA